MFFKQKYPIFLNILFALVILTLAGFGCKGGNSEAINKASEKITLNWWRVQGKAGDLKDITTEYKNLHPNVSVNIKILRSEELEQNLLEALASGTGPDIVSLPNTHLVGWQDKLIALPPTLTLPTTEISGWLKKEAKTVLKTNSTLNLRELRETFVDTVATDSVINNKIFGLPLSFDSLLLYYNRDLLNVADIPTPPLTWSEFSEAVTRLTKLDKQGKIVQSGAAIGEATNVPYAADILAALMLQNGTPIVDDKNSSAAFAKIINRGGEEFAPGADALRFYTDFASPAKETYTWSRDESSAFESFTSGKTAFVFGLWQDRNLIKTLSPKLNFEVTNFPQLDTTGKPIYYAKYYIETVTKQSKHPSEAWDLLLFVSKSAQINKYLTAAKVPTAHRSQVSKQLDDLDLAIPAKQILTARSWYHGYKPKLAWDGLASMIHQLNAGAEIEAVLQFGAAQVTQSLQKPK